MTSDPWKELGYAIRQARLGRGWNLEKLAGTALGNEARKGYVGQVEKGTRNLSPETIDKFDQALELPAEIVKAANLAPPPDKAEDAEANAAKDTAAEKLLAKEAKDPNRPQVAEALLTTLAYEYAGGDYLDLHTAYTALRQALETAEDLRKRGQLQKGNPKNQLDAVLAEVAKLNDEGAFADADDLLEAEEQRMLAEHEAEQERQDAQAKALLDRRIDQDRLRNRPEDAANRLIANIIKQAPPGGVFQAVDALAIRWRDDGHAAGDLFALNVALHIAKSNYEDRAKGKRPLEGFALFTLGNCHFRLAERSSKLGHLKVAKNAFEAAIKKTNKQKDPLNWAAQQGGLGGVSHEIGERDKDTAILHLAIKAYRATLLVYQQNPSPNLKQAWHNLGIVLLTLGELAQEKSSLQEAEQALSEAVTLKDKTADPVNWAASQMSCALAQRWLGSATSDMDKLTEARDGYADCEALKYEVKAPFEWAKLQWNIADLALARFRLDPDHAHLIEARDYLAKARAFFVDGSEYQTQRCDELLAEIDAAEAG